MAGVNDTIMKMVKNLIPTEGDDSQNIKFDYNTRNCDTPVKRSLSSSSQESSSIDEPVYSAKKAKKENSFDVSYVGSPMEGRRLRADLIEARNTIRTLESKIKHLNHVRKEIEILCENDTKFLKIQHERDRNSIERLESEIDVIRKRENVLKQELAEARSKHDLMKIKYDQRIEDLEKELSNSICETKQTKGDENAEIAMLKRKLSEIEDLLQAAEGDAEAQKKLNDELVKQLTRKTQLEKDFDQKDKDFQKAKLRIKELEYAKENFLEFQEQVKTQAQKLAHYVELLKETERLREENANLKDEVKNKLLLEEEVYDLKKRLVKYKEQETKLANLQMQQIQTEMSLNEWKAVTRGICETTESDASLPHLLRSTVEKLYNQEVLLTSEKTDLQSQLSAAVHEAKVAKDELEKNRKLLDEMKEADKVRQNLIHRMHKKLRLISRERDSYKQQIDSFEKDLTINFSMSAVGSSAANQLQTQKDRIENLEKIVSEYRDLVSKLENDLQNAEYNPLSDLAPIKADQFARLQSEVSQLKQENDRLRERNDQLEIQLEGYVVGNDTLRGGQVYHLAQNPLSDCLAQRQCKLEEVEEENSRLKRKIKNMEEGLESSRLANITLSTQEVLDLREELKRRDTKMEHLKNFYKSSMQDFRDLVYMLLGYRIDHHSPSAIYVLTSIYAERPEDNLQFKLNEDGTLELIENEYSKTLESLIDLHLRHQNSFPVFLSGVTFDLFNNKTMTTKIL